MTKNLLHRATHLVPGVPAHVERPAGHQGTTTHGRPGHPGGPAAAAEQSDARGAEQSDAKAMEKGANGRWNHSPARPPRFMAGWQRRVAAFFRREL